MTEPMSAVLILKSLDGLSQRAAAIAENIANANTPGYRPVRVAFETALRTAAARGPNEVRNVKPVLTPDQDPDGLRLDLELAESATVAGRYTALVEILNRQMQIRSLALSQGR